MPCPTRRLREVLRSAKQLSASYSRGKERCWPQGRSPPREAQSFNLPSVVLIIVPLYTGVRFLCEMYYVIQPLLVKLLLISQDFSYCLHTDEWFPYSHWEKTLYPYWMSTDFSLSLSSKRHSNNYYIYTPFIYYPKQSRDDKVSKRTLRSYANPRPWNTVDLASNNSGIHEGQGTHLLLGTEDNCSLEESYFP